MSWKIVWKLKNVFRWLRFSRRIFHFFNVILAIRYLNYAEICKWQAIIHFGGRFFTRLSKTKWPQSKCPKCQFIRRFQSLLPGFGLPIKKILQKSIIKSENTARKIVCQPSEPTSCGTIEDLLFTLSVGNFLFSPQIFFAVQRVFLPENNSIKLNEKHMFILLFECVSPTLINDKCRIK